MPAWLQRMPIKKIFIYLVLVTVWIILAGIIGQLKPKNAVSGGWDFEKFWVAPRLILEGKSPYDQTAWLAVHQAYPYAPQSDAFVYPLPFAIILLPLGFLSLENAAILWAAIILAAFWISLYLIFPDILGQPLAYLLPMLAGLVLFRPSMVNFYLLQIDVLILLCLSAALHLWQRDRLFWGGLVLSLVVFIKPTIGLPILGFIFLWQVVRGKRAAMLGEVSGCAALLISGLILDPAWVTRWLSSSGAVVTQYLFSTPSLWGVSYLVCQPSLTCSIALGAALTSGISLLTLWIILRKPAHDLPLVMSLVICANLVISPYLWTYTQVILLIPLLSINVALLRLRVPYMLSASFSLLFALFSAALVGLSMRVGVDVLSAGLPVVAAVLIYGMAQIDEALLGREPYPIKKPLPIR